MKLAVGGWCNPRWGQVHFQLSSCKDEEVPEASVEVAANPPPLLIRQTVSLPVPEDEPVSSA